MFVGVVVFSALFACFAEYLFKLRDDLWLLFQGDDFGSVTTDYNQMISTEESNGIGLWNIVDTTDAKI